MLFALVQGRPFTCVCCRCKTVTRAGDGVGPVWADLDGEPFIAYYCERCKRSAQEAYYAQQSVVA